MAGALIGKLSAMLVAESSPWIGKHLDDLAPGWIGKCCGSVDGEHYKLFT